MVTLGVNIVIVGVIAFILLLVLAQMREIVVCEARLQH